MKVIHTFTSKDIIWKEQLYVMVLSALYAKKHYGNINLYCSDKQANQFKELPEIYSNIDTSILKPDYKVYSYPKLITYLNQKEPFLHIDHDSVIFSKIDFNKVKTPFLFSHPEVKHLVRKVGTFGYHIPLLLSGHDGDYNYIKSSYLDLIEKLSSKFPNSISKEFDFESIPNMNLTYVSDPDTYREAVENSILYYHDNKEVINKHPFGAHHIEQFMIHQQLLSLSKDYKKAVKKQNSFLQPHAPLSISLKDQKKLFPSIKETKFPFKFRIYSKCKCCKTKGLVKHKVTSPENISEYFGYKFNGFTHFSFMQWYQIWQALIINEIVEEFGIEYVMSIHNLFRKLYPSYKLPIVSEGELLYEKIKGEKIFSN